jgi:DNA-binding NarL/FixJ family response regulator
VVGICGGYPLLGEHTSDPLGVEGAGGDELAAQLFISPATARTYVSRLLGKLDARDHSQLLIIAYESGLVTPGQA